MAIDYKKLAEQAAEMQDQTETTTGGDFERSVIPEGVTIGRFIEYIELGVQPQRPFKGADKPPIAQARLVFELTHPRHARKIEVDGKEVTVYDKHSETVTISLNEKSKFTKLLKTMSYGRPIKHFAQMLNDAFIFDFKHNKKEKDGKEVTYVNLYNDGNYGIKAPIMHNPIDGTSTPVPVPNAVSPIRIFLWDNPTKETWDSLHIAGTRTVKEGKTEKQVSKNWLQELILSAKNFTGSPLEDLLTGSKELTEAVEKAEVKATGKKSAPAAAEGQQSPQASPEAPTAKTASPSKAETKKAKAPKAKAEPASAVAFDPLAALGL